MWGAVASRCMPAAAFVALWCAVLWFVKGWGRRDFYIVVAALWRA